MCAATCQQPFGTGEGAGTEVCYLFYLMNYFFVSLGVKLDGVVDPIGEPSQELFGGGPRCFAELQFLLGDWVLALVS